jgi:hypothetical protein
MSGCGWPETPAVLICHVVATMPSKLAIVVNCRRTRKARRFLARLNARSDIYHALIRIFLGIYPCNHQEGEWWRK